VAFGSLRYPFTTDKLTRLLGMDVSVKDFPARQIEYEHQDPRIHGISSRGARQIRRGFRRPVIINERSRRAKTPA
jgi:hypothetical protein